MVDNFPNIRSFLQTILRAGTGSLNLCMALTVGVSLIIVSQTILACMHVAVLHPFLKALQVGNQTNKTVICTDSPLVARSLNAKILYSPMLTCIYNVHQKLLNNHIQIELIWTLRHNCITASRQWMAHKFAKKGSIDQQYHAYFSRIWIYSNIHLIINS